MIKQYFEKIRFHSFTVSLKDIIANCLSKETFFLVFYFYKVEVIFF